MKEKLLEKFEEIFGDAKGAKVFFVPGRVNLIGDHTDYNGGHVFPCVLNLGTYAVAKKREDNKLRFYSLNFEETGMVESSLADLNPCKDAGWTNYPKGVIWAFGEKGMPADTGMDMLVYGNLPNGAGLSSSASVEVLTGLVLRELFGFCVQNIELALIGQFSENKFNGVNCGIMDQFAVAMGKTGEAIFLNTSNLDYSYAPLHLEGYRIVIINTNKKRGLGESKYNERRSECEEALRRLQTVADIRRLGDLTESKFEELQMTIGDAVLTKRAKHAVLENLRTMKAVEALKEDDLVQFGKLMVESHVSLRDDYEVSCPELDTIVEESLKAEGVLGCRMTGGGFGGCCVSIVAEDKVDAFIEQVGEAYLKKIGYEASFYVVEVGDGPQIL